MDPKNSSPTSSRQQPPRNERKLNSIELTPEVIIQKIVQHSRNPSSPRLVKYLGYAKKTFSSSNLKLWMDLRTKGGILAIETVIKNSVNKEGVSNYKTISQDVLTSSLSILGNSYSLDYCARKDVANSGFTSVLHKLIQVPTTNIVDGYQNSVVSCNADAINKSQNDITSEEPPPFSPAECDLKTKAVKCIANLAHDTTCRDAVLKSGIGITLLKVLETFNEYWNKKQEPQNASTTSDVEANLHSKSKEAEIFSECAKASVRAIRILSSESRCEDAKCHLIRFGAVNTVGQILKWALNPELKLDVVRSLANLTDKIKLLPREQVQEFVAENNNNSLLKDLITVLDGCSVDEKFFFPTIRCLINFAGNTHIAEKLGNQQIFRVVLDKLGQTTEKASTEICRLLIALTKHSGVNRCLLYSEQEVWTTMQILRSDGLQEHHRWLLHVYENVYEGTLKSLLRNGLIELIHEHFKKELEDCDYVILKRKIMSLDVDICKVHGDHCQFIPTYRCDSPSYQQVQEEMKNFIKDRDSTYKMDIDSGSSGIDSSSSPSSSPARSWSSDDSGSESGVGSARFRRSDSPASSSSDDEGCYSPVYSSLSLSPTYSEGSPSETSCSHDRSWHESIVSPRQPKYPKLNSTSHIPFVDEEDQHVNSLSSRNTKTSDSIKNKSKKIVVMLNILQKASFLSPIPDGMANIIPILLSFIIRGIVSLTPQKLRYEDHSKDIEMTHLGRRSFSVAYRILKKLCLDIKFFPDMVKNGTITIVSRLLPWDAVLTSFESTENISTLLDTLRGKGNDTSGWREGHLMRTLLISQSDEELTKVSLTIPLLFRKNDHSLRSFEQKGSSWTRVFELLTKNTNYDDTSPFQDCILTLSTLSETIGMKYDVSEVSKRPNLIMKDDTNIGQILQFLDSSNDLQQALTNFEHDGKVKITLDDGSLALLQKNILTDASPVFCAMFDGHFKEAGSQAVHIRNISKESLKVLVLQLQILNNHQCLKQSDLNNTELTPIDNLDLSTIFELISLSDQFLMDTLYERTLNTLLSFYICPHSAPRIYQEAVKLSALWKPQSRLKGLDMDLTFVVLKYLLVGDLTFTSRCGAFRKIFDSVPSDNVVGDLRALVEFYSSRPQQTR